jgi:hypothetical protein
MSNCLDYPIETVQHFRDFWYDWGVLIQSKTWRLMLTEDELEILIRKIKHGREVMEDYIEACDIGLDGIDDEIAEGTESALENIQQRLNEIRKQ